MFTFIKDILNNDEWRWNLNTLSQSPLITIEIVKNNPDIPWCPLGLSRNPNLTMDWLDKNPDIPWDWEYLSFKKNLTMDIVEKYIDKAWNWTELTKNATINIMKQYPHVKWNFTWITMHTSEHFEEPQKDATLFEENEENEENEEDEDGDYEDDIINTSMTDFREYIRETPYCHYDSYRKDILTKNAHIILDDIEGLEYEDWWPLSENPNITSDFVEKHINENWNWETLSQNLKIGLDFIEKYKDWCNWHFVCLRTDLTVDFINRNLEEIELWTVSRHVDINIIKNNPNTFKWDWDEISGRLDITIDLIVNNLDKKWDWWVLAENPMPVQKKIEKIFKEITTLLFEKIFEPDSHYITRTVQKRFQETAEQHYKR